MAAQADLRGAGDDQGREEAAAMKNEQSGENTKVELKDKDGRKTPIRLDQLAFWRIKHAEKNQGRGKADRMKIDKKRTGAFLILFAIGSVVVLWFFFGDTGWRDHPAFLSFGDVEIEFKYILGTGALVVFWGIGLILSSLFPKKG
jgi:hypothetical protein